MTNATIIEHLSELRTRLLYSVTVILMTTILSFLFYDYLISYLVLPYTHLKIINSDTLYIYSLLEGFTTKIKFSFYLGLLFAFPIIIYQILKFIIPGLKCNERKIIIISLLFSFILAIAGFYLSYFYLIPYSIEFLTSTQFIPKNVGIILNFYQNIFYIFNFLIISFLVFQLPILMGVMLYLNILKRQPLWSAGRYITIAIFVFAAIITPPDIITQLSIGIPLTMLYFFILSIAKIFNWGNNNE
tara:strand:+ start:270 stop:1001 length:732 start_codon:yes stop_codon:yes gene_type:complete